MNSAQRVLADAIAGEARRQGETSSTVRGSDWQTAVVTAVDVAAGTVDCGPIRARRLESYGGAQVGDLIVITRSGTGNWVAWGRLRDSADTTTAGATAATGFDLVEWSARRVGLHCYIRLAVTRTGAAIAATAAGNISDTQLATLPAGWRPVEPIVETVACDGFGDGGCQIQDSGAVVLRTWSAGGSIQSPRTVRVSANYLL